MAPLVCVVMWCVLEGNRSPLWSEKLGVQVKVYVKLWVKV